MAELGIPSSGIGVGSGKRKMRNEEIEKKNKKTIKKEEKQEEEAKKTETRNSENMASHTLIKKTVHQGKKSKNKNKTKKATPHS